MKQDKVVHIQYILRPSKVIKIGWKMWFDFIWISVTGYASTFIY